MGLLPFSWNVEKRKKKRHIWKTEKEKEGEVDRHARESRIPMATISTPSPFLFWSPHSWHICSFVYSFIKHLLNTSHCIVLGATDARMNRADEACALLTNHLEVGWTSARGTRDMSGAQDLEIDHRGSEA